MNSFGDVTGQMGDLFNTGFIYHHGRLRALVPPRGYSGSLLTGINDSGVIIAKTYSMDGTSAAFAVVPRNSAYTWVRLPLGSKQASDATAAAIDSHGNIAGSIILGAASGAGRERSVEWHRRANGTFTKPHVLPLSPGFNISIAGSIWNRRGVSYVGGAQGDGTNQDVSLWGSGSSVTPSPGGLPFASSLGGRDNHVFAAGTVYGQGAYGAWFGRVRFEKSGIASIRSVNRLPLPGGYFETEAAAVTADRNGQAIVVGDALQPALNESAAVLWRSQSYVLLQTFLPAGTPWNLTDASAINLRGQIAGGGNYGGLERAFLLSPVS
jgi:hypothetical protein